MDYCLQSSLFTKDYHVFDVWVRLLFILWNTVIFPSILLAYTFGIFFHTGISKGGIDSDVMMEVRRYLFNNDCDTMYVGWMRSNGLIF